MHRLTRLTRCRSQYVTTALQCVLRRTGVLSYKHFFYEYYRKTALLTTFWLKN